ncbi:PorV/PorQ family protein [bacterium]|nr:PorV/PorQ family protein [bacterium]NUN46141.1 PorV/PorQ family protein [bacterium]
MKHKILALALALMYTINAFAGEEKRGTAGFMFLKVPMGAREVALGQSGITTTSGANAIYWNPANVSAATSPTFSFSYLNHFAGISSNYGAITFPMGDAGVIGASINYMSYGDIQRTSEANPDGGIGNYAPYELSVGVTFAKQVTDRVSGGLTVKFINSQIDLVSASNYAFDFGFTYNTDFRGLKLGFVVNNLGPQASYKGDGLLQTITVDPLTNETAYLAYESEFFNMPASVNFGASMDLMRNEQNSITGMLEQNINSFQASRTNFGLEYGFQNMFFARAGYTSTLKKDRDYNTGSDAGMSGLTMGAGVDYKFNDSFGATVDYGYLNMGILGGTHRFSVGFKF